MNSNKNYTITVKLFLYTAALVLLSGMIFNITGITICGSILLLITTLLYIGGEVTGTIQNFSDDDFWY